MAGRGRRSPLRALLLFFLLPVCAMLICVGSCFAIVGFVFSATRPVGDAANSFLVALRDADYEALYTLASPELQGIMESPAGARSWANTLGSRPTDWNLNHFSVRNNGGSVQGTAQLADGRQVSVHIILGLYDGRWRVISLSFVIGSGSF